MTGTSPVLVVSWLVCYKYIISGKYQFISLLVSWLVWYKCIISDRYQSVFLVVSWFLLYITNDRYQSCPGGYCFPGGKLLGVI